MQSLDPFKSVTQRDADGLRQALTQGWKPPTIHAKNGAQPDFSVWTETIVLDWEEGLGLLDDFLPAITRRSDVMIEAVRGAHTECVKLLWNRLGLKAEKNKSEQASGQDTVNSPSPMDTNREYDLGQDNDGGKLAPRNIQTETARTVSQDDQTNSDSQPAESPQQAKRDNNETLGPGHITIVTNRMVHIWCREIMVAMGKPWAQEQEAKNVVPLMKFFVDNGINVDSYIYPGDYESGDFRRAGHSLWTRAVFLKNWDIVGLLWPKSENVWKAWPRVNEVLLHVLDVSVGDYLGLHVNEGNSSLVEAELMNGDVDWESVFELADEDKEATKPIAYDQKTITKELSTTLRWITEYGTVWARQEGLKEPLSQPTPKRIAAWLRLPTVLTRPEDRDVIWKVWDDICSIDANRAWLADLTLWPEDDDVIALIEVAKGDSCAVFRKWWNEAASDKNLSPAQRWASMGGDKSLTSWTITNN